MVEARTLNTLISAWIAFSFIAAIAEMASEHDAGAHFAQGAKTIMLENTKLVG